MNISSFGSRIIDDAISKYDISHNKMNIRGISPFSLSTDAIEGKIKIDEENINDAYKKNILHMDLNKSISISSKCDYVVIDFLEAYTKVREYYFESGRSVRITESCELEKIESKIEKQLCHLIGERIIKKEIIDPLSWNNEDIRKEVEKFCKWLTLNFSIEKIVLLENNIPYHRKDKNGVIEVDNFEIIYKYQNFFRMCEKCFKENIKCQVIPHVSLALGEERCTRENILYEEAYYKYIVDMLIHLNAESSKKIEIIGTYNELLQEEIDRCLISNIIERVKKQLKQRKIILIGGNEKLRRFIEEQYELKIENILKYCSKRDFEILATRLEQYKEKYEEYLFIIPHLYHDKLLELLYKYHFFRDRDVFLPQHEMIYLKNFKGEYEDIYHNKVICKKELNIFISGIGGNICIENSNKVLYTIDIVLRDQASVYIGENVSGHLLKISTWDGGMVTIEKDVTFADNCFIFTVVCSHVVIGEDSMFSSKVIVHAGDGHSIFEVKNGLKTSATPAVVGTAKNEIIIGKHVWVGYQAFLLCGCNVGDGSIIGARSVVKKRFPNNCIIAGNEPKIIKKDIGWARDPFATDIYSENIADSCLGYTKMS